MYAVAAGSVALYGVYRYAFASGAPDRDWLSKAEGSGPNRGRLFRLTAEGRIQLGELKTGQTVDMCGQRILVLPPSVDDPGALRLLVIRERAISDVRSKDSAYVYQERLSVQEVVLKPNVAIETAILGQGRPVLWWPEGAPADQITPETTVAAQEIESEVTWLPPPPEIEKPSVGSGNVLGYLLAQNKNIPPRPITQVEPVFCQVEGAPLVYAQIQPAGTLRLFTSTASSDLKERLSQQKKAITHEMARRQGDVEAASEAIEQLQSSIEQGAHGLGDKLAQRLADRERHVQAIQAMQLQLEDPANQFKLKYESKKENCGVELRPGIPSLLAWDAMSQTEWIWWPISPLLEVGDKKYTLEVHRQTKEKPSRFSHNGPPLALGDMDQAIKDATVRVTVTVQSAHPQEAQQVR
eukprot:gb/GEZN01007006.1/.p1 GENE.gb/GEZN01007006.1/~~gb/GEZN01007006.1/.p1  ORF type:complete len:410 (+),score=53.24 gb/GEZN01007006.1/:28-1257(+)